MTGPSVPAASRPAGSGDAAVRLTPRMVLLIFGLFLVVFLLFAFLGSVILQAPPPPPVCDPGQECGGPPVDGGAGPGAGAASIPPGSTSPVPGTMGIRAGTPWSSTDLSFEFEYWPGWWSIVTEKPREVEFRIDSDGYEGVKLQVAGVPASDASVQQYAEQWVATLSDSIADLKLDPSGKNAILGAEIGFVDGLGQTYAGSISNAQGGSTPVGVSLVVATDGRTTAAVVLIVPNPDKPYKKVWRQHHIRAGVGLVLKTFRWGTGS
jgi:hypothetical protein